MDALIIHVYNSQLKEIPELCKTFHFDKNNEKDRVDTYYNAALYQMQISRPSLDIYYTRLERK